MENGTDSVEIEDGKASFKKTVIRFIVARYYMGLVLAVAIEALLYATSVHVFRVPTTLRIFIILASILWYFSAREETLSEKGGS